MIQFHDLHDCMLFLFCSNRLLCIQYLAQTIKPKFNIHSFSIMITPYARYHINMANRTIKTE